MGDNDFFQTEADQVSVWRAPECLLGVNLRHSQPCPECPLLGVERKKSGDKRTLAEAPATRYRRAAAVTVPAWRAPNGLRGSHCGAVAFDALSCGRDRVRWPVPLAVLQVPLVVEPVARGRIAAAGSLMLRRMDCWGHKRGLVRAKKHGTKKSR